jgi:hypothetical protein
MKAKLLMIGGVVAIAVVGWLLLPFSRVRADLEPDCAANPYGVDGELSEQDLKDLFYIAFPQTAVDMRGALALQRVLMLWQTITESKTRIIGSQSITAVLLRSVGGLGKLGR